MPTKHVVPPTKDTTTITIPSFSQFAKYYNPLLVICLVVASFFLGSYYTKSKLLESKFLQGGQVAGAQQAVPNPPAGGPQQPPLPTNDDVKKWAKDIGLDAKKFNSCYDQKKFDSNVTTDATDGRNAGVSGTPTFYINGYQLVGAQPFAAFKDAIEKVFNGQPAVSGTPTQVGTGSLPLLGNANAVVTIIEFSDLQCPFCKRFNDDTFPQLKKEYIDTGKVAFYFRHFPLEFHPMATPFANAAECANDQGKFWQMHDKIFQKQG